MAENASQDADLDCGVASRLAAIRPYEILDTPREAEYDDLAALAAQVCAAPIALISFVLADRQWFKAETGLGVRETPLDESICQHLLLTPGLTIISDTRADPRTANNPLVTAEPGLRFYAGHLLASADGMPLGTLCVLDRRPRAGLDPAQRFALQTLARQLMAQLELRRALLAQHRLIEQKDLLFTELNHRIKNSLQLVAALIQLQSGAACDQQVRAQLAAARGRVLTVAQLHEHLYPTADVAEVDLGDYLRTLLAKLTESAPARTKLRLETDRAIVATDRAVPMALIVNELVTNAIKHAHRDSGLTQVVVRVESVADGGLQVTVTDDGVGLPAAFDPGAAGASLGLRIITGLVRQLGASLRWDNRGGGACFMIDLPVTHPLGKQ